MVHTTGNPDSRKRGSFLKDYNPFPKKNREAEEIEARKIVEDEIKQFEALSEEDLRELLEDPNYSPATNRIINDIYFRKYGDNKKEEIEKKCAFCGVNTAPEEKGTCKTCLAKIPEQNATLQREIYKRNKAKFPDLY